MLLAYAAGSTPLAWALLVVLALDVAIRARLVWQPRQIVPEPPEHCTVLRNGQTRRIEAAKLVAGDIVLLQAGDTVPADGRLLTTDGGFTVDESILFAGASPEKSTASLPATAPLSARHNMVWMGTRVTRGTGAAIVTAIGVQTELGRIIILANAAQAEQLHKPAWNSGWLAAGGAFLAAAAAGWISDVDERALASGLVVLGLCCLPLGINVARVITLLKCKPRSDVRLSLMARLGTIDTLLTSEVSVARFKAFHLRVLHVGHRANAQILDRFSDEQLSARIQAGGGAFGELLPEDKVRLVRSAQLTGHRVAVMMRDLSDLPALFAADAGVENRSDLAAVLAAAKTAAISSTHAWRFVRQWTLALALLAALGIAGAWYAHFPLVLNPAAIVTFSAIILPLLAIAVGAAKSSTSEMIVRASVVAALAYLLFLLYFGLNAINPAYIDPANPMVLRAVTAVLVLLVMCAAVEQLFSTRNRRKRSWLWPALAAAITLFAVYSPGLQAVLGTTGLDITGWTLALAAAGLYFAAMLLQKQARHHSRTVIISLHHRTFGKASGARI
jgi:magnesium-transporting ATPase (P-type)